MIQKQSSKNKNDNERIIYYNDELNDEFSGKNIIPRNIDSMYKYIHKNPFWNIASFLLRKLVITPVKYIYPKVKFDIEIVGKEKLKKYKNMPYFLYANHTQVFADTIIPTLAVGRKSNSFIVNPENVSMKYLGNIVQMLGAIPIPNKIDGMENFINAIKNKINKNNVITIYPEAHIWPYYTKIRPFSNVSFKYPVEYNTPVFCLTNTYVKSKNPKKPKIITYIDGPFFKDDSLNKKMQKQKLRDTVYECMLKRSKNSNFEYIKYIKNEK